MNQDVDPRFVRYFGLQIWKRAQEKEYFEKRKAAREWWWNNTVLLAWKCLTKAHLIILLLGTWNIAKALFWIRLQWLLLGLAAQSTCSLGLAVAQQCNVTHPDNLLDALGTCPANITEHFSETYLRFLVHYDPMYLYSWIPGFIERAVTSPFLMTAYCYRWVTLPLAQWWWGFTMTGVVCVK